MLKLRVMKNKLLLQFFIFSLLHCLLSCTQDSYDKGEGDYSQMIGKMAMGYTSSDKLITHFVTDDGEQLKVAKPFASSLMPKADTVYRAVFYYNPTDRGAEVMGLNRVTVINPHVYTSPKTDPVRVESVWLSKTKEYLNLSLYLMLGTTDDKEAVQRIGCHRDTLIQNTDGTRTLHLIFCHDQGNVPEFYSQRIYCSIPTQDVDVDSISLRINTYQGLITSKTKL